MLYLWKLFFRGSKHKSKTTQKVVTVKEMFTRKDPCTNKVSSSENQNESLVEVFKSYGGISHSIKISESVLTLRVIFSVSLQLREEPSLPLKVPDQPTPAPKVPSQLGFLRAQPMSLLKDCFQISKIKLKTWPRKMPNRMTASMNFSQILKQIPCDE